MKIGETGRLGAFPADSSYLCFAQEQLSPSIEGPCQGTTSECVVVIPTYNEKENIARLIERIQSLGEPVDILVVDDNSPDGTASVVRQMIRRRDGIYLLQRARKAGLGTAYREGFAFALCHGWKYICQMDADFSHDPQDLPRLIAKCRDSADVAIGSRYVKGGRIQGWPWKRWLLSRAANLYAQVLTKTGVRDLTGGFKCFRRKALEAISLEAVSSEGYVFQVEMNYRARRKGLRISELPVCFTDRREGISKMGKNEALDGFVQLLRVTLLSEKPRGLARRSLIVDYLLKRKLGCIKEHINS